MVELSKDFFEKDLCLFADKLFSLPEIENVDKFWFIQIQALGKLYCKDHLISSHLANMNINETLVQQMILRDRKYKTNHHRYGYEEELIMIRHMKQFKV